MARFDVWRLRDGGYVLDCQVEFLDSIATCFVVPLLPLGEGPPPNPRINPVFEVEGEELVMTTQFAASIRRQDLRDRAGSLADEGYRIVGAIDALIGTG